MPFISGAIALIGTIGSFVGTLGGVGSALLTIGINLAAKAIINSLSSKSKKTQASGVELELQFGEEQSRKISTGLNANAGHLVYANSYGAGNTYLQHLRLLSDFYCTSLEKVFIDGKEETLGAVDSAGRGRVVVTGEFANLIWIKFVDGRQTLADDVIINNSNPVGRVGSTDAFLGCAYVIITMEFKNDVLNSIPDFLFEYKGAPLYDFRKDSSIGGFGSHRWNDTTTWEFSSNPIILAYNYHRGFYINSDVFCGMEINENDLPLGKWAIAANICDENVGLELRYGISYQIDCNQNHGENIDNILKTCNAFMAEGVDGLWPIVGSNQPVVATFSDDDIITNSSENFRRYSPMNELVNSVNGTFTSPENLWGQTAYNRATDSGLVAVDRRSRDVDMNFETVISLRQATQLASIYFRENRFEKTATLTLRPYFQDLEVGDWVQWNSEFSIKSGVYMVAGYELLSDSDEEGPRNVKIQLIERSATIYDTTSPIPLPFVINPADPFYQQEMVNFVAVGQTIVGENSIQQSAIRASWNKPFDPTVSGIIIEYRVKSGHPDNIVTKTITNNALITILNEGVVKNTIYEIRHKLITDPLRFTVPTAWIEVTSSDALNAIDFEDLSRETKEYIKTLDVKLAATLAQANDNAWHDSFALMGGLVESTKHGIETEKSSAFVRKETRALATETEALAQNLVEVAASLEGKADVSVVEAQSVRITANEADIVSQADSITTINNILPNKAESTVVNILSTTVSFQGGQISAQASALTAVEAKTNAGTASGLVGWQATSAPSGVSARYAIFGKASSGDVIRQGGAFLDVTPATAFWTFFADQVRFADSSGNLFALFTAGGTTIDSARIGNLSANSITTGTFDTERFGSRSINATKMIIGSCQGNANLAGSTNDGFVGEIIIADRTINYESGSAGNVRGIQFQIAISCSGSWGSGAGGGTFGWRVKCDDGNGSGRVVSTRSATTTSTTGSANLNLDQFIIDEVLIRSDGTVRYYVEKFISGSNISYGLTSTSKLLFWKF